MSANTGFLQRVAQAAHSKMVSAIKKCELVFSFYNSKLNIGSTDGGQE